MTLIEYCITLGLLSIIMLAGFTASIDLYRHTFFSSQKQVFTSALENSRDKAMIEEREEVFDIANIKEDIPLLLVSSRDILIFNYLGNPEVSSIFTISQDTYKSLITVYPDGSIY